MDKKIFRSFELKPLVYQDPDGHDVTVQQLHMYSVVDGEYGPIKLWVHADLYSIDFNFACMFLFTSGASADLLFELRQAELQYFLSFILPLFNPLKRLSNEIQETQSETPDLS